MIYLDNAATTFPKPACVYDRVDAVQRTIAVNVGRGGYRAAMEAMEIVDETRELLSAFAGASGAESVVLTPSATIAANEIILGLEWGPYKTVYVTPFEHNAIARPLHRVCGQYGIELRLLPFNAATQTLEEEELARRFALHPPDYVFLNQVSNVTGVVVPVDAVARRAKESGALVIVDASQSLGLIPASLNTSPVDYLIFAGHKNLYASWGVGGFIRNCGYPLKPALSGGTGSDSLNLDMTGSFPGGFEPGSPNILAIASLNESLKWSNRMGPESIAERKTALVSRLAKGLTTAGATLYLPGGDVGHTSVVSFNLPGYQANEVGMILNEDFDIAVRSGYHCAPFVHGLLDTITTQGTVRASVGFFNTEADIDALIVAVKDLMGDLE